MVVIKIWGGLGNQLFQYSFGKYLAHRLSTQVKYDIQTVNRLSNYTQRDFILSEFNAIIDTVSTREVNFKRHLHNTLLTRLERKMAQQMPFLFSKYFVEPDIPVPPEKLRLRDNCYYDGYWQSFRYLVPIEDRLRKEITLRQPVSGDAAVMLRQIRQCVSVSIHVRRSDYLQHPNLINCSLQYYFSAIEHIRQLQSNVHFFVFSDDMDWCRKHFTGTDFTFVEGNSNYVDLVLMSTCAHQIIANSTFSWWAAWLNTNPGKEIVAPGRWNTKKDSQLHVLLPAGWTKLNV
jgi:hypothetical protein